MKLTLEFGDKRVVHDNVDSLFFSFSEVHLLVHKNGETFPIELKQLKSIKAETTKLKKEGIDAYDNAE